MLDTNVLDPATTPALRHRGFARMFAPDRLSLGLMLPTTPLVNGVPDMSGQLDIAARADELGFAGLWSRDVPLFDPAFGDAGQVYDPWVWLGALAMRTSRIALSTAGIVLPLRHPLHSAKAAASIDALSGGRFVLGAASGDRPVEYPAFDLDHATRGAAYREAIEVIRRTTSESYPILSGTWGEVAGLDLLPKAPDLPLMAIGGAQQSVQWIAEHMDAWVTYPRDLEQQRGRIDLWKAAVAARAPGVFRPFAQSLFVDLTDDPDTAPSEIFLGYRLGRRALIDHLDGLEAMGVNHVAI
ncbi:MAG: LLM class oxidoreductase, partial [Pseudomonadota bacterium]